jgi:hypothetical protein
LDTKTVEKLKEARRQLKDQLGSIDAALKGGNPDQYESRKARERQRQAALKCQRAIRASDHP